MGKNKKKQKANPVQSVTPVDVAEKVRAALRSIIRDWKTLRAPLPVDAMPDFPSETPRFKVRGAESFEELQEQVIQFAGRVWQLKDGLIKWLKTRPGLELLLTDAIGRSVKISGGPNAERGVEDAAKLCLPLLLCADLYNTHKHYDDCNRSGYQPFLNGVQLDGTNVGSWGIRYDGARKSGEFTVANAAPVPFRIEILSRNHQAEFGDAVINVGIAFRHWLPVIRNMGLLSPTEKVDRAILDDLVKVEAEINGAKLFKPEDATIDLGSLSADQRFLLETDPGKFIANVAAASPKA
jgi:hypothetical protein